VGNKHQSPLISSYQLGHKLRDWLVVGGVRALMPLARHSVILVPGSAPREHAQGFLNSSRGRDPVRLRGPDQQKLYGQASKPRATQTARVTQDAALSLSQRTAKTTELPIFLGAAY
jgi:hypothetical protein